MEYYANVLSDLLTKNYFTLCLLVLLTLAIWKIKFKSKNGYTLPPHVSGDLPIIGHLLYLIKNPHLKMEEYKKKYGNIFSVSFGMRYTVVLTDFEILKEALKNEALSNRVPRMVAISDEFQILLELNGKEGMDHRRFAVTALKGIQREKSTEDIIQAEISRLMVRLNATDLSGDLDMRSIISTLTNNVAFSMICGKSYDEGHPMSEFLLDFNSLLQDFLMLKTLAYSLKISNKLLWLVRTKYEKIQNIISQMNTFISSEIVEHEKILNPEDPKDYIDMALLELQKPADSRKLKLRSQILGDAQLLLLAGSDTIRTTFEWMALLMAKYPIVQEKIYQEILDVLGDKRPTWKDHMSMPYTEATITECERVCMLIPLIIPRIATKDIILNGFDIPKGTLVLADFWSVHNDPKLFQNPEVFDPTRFISKDGRSVSIPEYFVGFSYGSRNCLGDKIAKMEMFLLVSSVFQKYRVKPSTKGVSMDNDLKLTRMPRFPEVRFELR